MWVVLVVIVVVVVVQISNSTSTSSNSKINSCNSCNSCNSNSKSWFEKVRSEQSYLFILSLALVGKSFVVKPVSCIARKLKK